MANMVHRNRLVGGNDRRIVLRDSEKRAARTIIRLHYSFFCVSIGFILGAWNYYNQFTQIRSAVFVATGGLLIAGYLGACWEDRDDERAEETQEAEAPQETEASYHLHYGPLGIVNHRDDHDVTFDHNYGSFLYDYKKYEL